MARSTLYLAFFALAAPWLYDRYQALSHIYQNRPGSLEPIYGFKSHEIKFTDRLRNCEDVILDEKNGVAVLSCSPGRDKWNSVMGVFKPGENMERGAIYVYNYAQLDIPDGETLNRVTFEGFDDGDFHPLGIEYVPEESRLYVINNAQSGSVIEIFQFDAAAHSAQHVKTVRHPLIYTPNAIHAIGEDKIFFTNDHYVPARTSTILSQIETFAGIPGGSVVYMDLNDPDSAKTLAHIGFANGIGMLNSTTLAVASSSKPGVYFYDVTPEHDLKYKYYLRTPVGVDNISVDSDGKLLMAGHPYALSLIQVAEARANCVLDSEKEEEKEACGCGSPSWAAEWSEESGLKELYKGHDICSSSTVARDAKRGVGFVSTLYDRGLMIFRE
ncbi:calcium-dependent phosphotriesterase [Polyplosphaeria fusca]|uniref:Calcium-dependent phosphotriesterase n=1 Tax=Polyplosphaeria fusca TaxID=682080 RepID=A0A9P4R951_9PLEO|nr:calcium-dependent phosphotriesterase [Polyplosphaeria fusca]